MKNAPQGRVVHISLAGERTSQKALKPTQINTFIFSSLICAPKCAPRCLPLGAFEALGCNRPTRPKSFIGGMCHQNNRPQQTAAQGVPPLHFAGVRTKGTVRSGFAKRQTFNPPPASYHPLGK